MKSSQQELRNLIILYCLLLATHHGLTYYQQSTTTATTYSDRLFSKVTGVVYQSPYATAPETRCSGRPCAVILCAKMCEMMDSCVVFSHSPVLSACIFSPRPDHVPQNYQLADSNWNTYYTQCPVHMGYRLHTNHQPPLCLRFDPRQLPQKDARSFCLQEHADLVRVKSLNVYSIVKTIVTEANYDEWVWIGAEDGDMEGQFVWNDGTPLALGTSLWDKTTEGYRDDEDCTALSRSRKIIDDGCFWEAAFLCQYDV